MIVTFSLVMTTFTEFWIEAEYRPEDGSTQLMPTFASEYTKGVFSRIVLVSILFLTGMLCGASIALSLALY